MKRQSRGWWSVALGAALLVPSLAPRPVAAGPFDYVKAADAQTNQQHEQERRQAEERDRQQREQQERQRSEQEQRARQEQEQRSRQEQERRTNEDRQRQADQQRQAEQHQAEQQRQVEQQRQSDRQRQAEREQQERLRGAQAERERQRAEQERIRQEQRAREEQIQRARQEQAQREQARRAREEPAAQEPIRRERDPQAAPLRRVAAAPFDYIRKTDEVQNRGQQNSPRSQPTVRQEPSRPVREEHTPVPRSAPQPGSPIRVTGPQAGSSTPVYRPSPFGTVRPGYPRSGWTPPAARPSVPHSETVRPPGSFPAVGGYPGTLPRGTVRTSPFGSVRGRTEVVTPVPVTPRGGRGTLDGYFGRDPRRHRERNPRYYPYPYYPAPYYPGRFDGYYPYLSDGYYPCPYDLYPPTLYYLQPSPSIVVVPEPETIYVPEPQQEPEVVESSTLDEVITDIEEAWERGKLSLLMRHVRQEGEIQVYRDGEWVDTLSRADFERKTEQAFHDYDTVSMRFEKPELLDDDETGAPRARARATHIYKTRSGEERRVHVSYAFRRYGRVWRVVGLDYERPLRGRAAAPGAPPALSLNTAPRESTHAAKSSGLALAAPEQLRLVSAPPVRVRDLLNAHQPRQLATVKWLKARHNTLYSLQAMRGVVPGTIAWALYHRGEKRPVETGVTDISALPVKGWLAVRVQEPQLVTLASQAPARPRLARLATRSFGGASLALAPVKAPAKSTGHARHRTRRIR